MDRDSWENCWSGGHKILQEGSRLQPTQIDRDKGGHKAHVLEASRILFFSIFTKGTAYIPLWQSGLGKNCFKNKAHT